MSYLFKKITGWAGKLQLTGKDNSVLPELDPIRSQVGPYYKACTTANQHQSLLTTTNFPSNKKIHLDTLIMTNLKTTAVDITLYDSIGTTTVVGVMTLGGDESLAITDAKGLIFGTGIYYRATLTNVHVTVGGLQRPELPSE